MQAVSSTAKGKSAIEELYDTYKDKAHIYMVYVREAHPTDGKMPASKKNPYQLTDPKTLKERREVAQKFAKDLRTSVPVLVDTIDDAATKHYGGWPDRLYVIDAEGKIALAGGPGPGGFTPAVREAPGVLKKLLEK